MPANLSFNSANVIDRTRKPLTAKTVKALNKGVTLPVSNREGNEKTPIQKTANWDPESSSLDKQQISTTKPSSVNSTEETRRNTATNGQYVPKASDAASDSCIFEDARHILSELNMKIAELKNTLVDLGNSSIVRNNNPRAANRLSSDCLLENGEKRISDHLPNHRTDAKAETDYLAGAVPGSSNGRSDGVAAFDRLVSRKALRNKSEHIPLAWERTVPNQNYPGPKIISSEKSVTFVEQSVVSRHLSSGEEENYNAMASPEHTTREVLPLFPSGNVACRTPTLDSAKLERLLKGSRAQSNADLVYCVSKVSAKATQDASNNKPKEISDTSDKENDLVESEMVETFISARSKTMPALSRPKMAPHKVASLNEGERLNRAKELVEQAIKFKKIFTIQGGYSTIRHSLRRRGWVEKFYKIPVPPKKMSQAKKQKSSDEEDNDFDDDVVDNNDDDDDDDNDVDVAVQAPTDDHQKLSPWEEDDGLYGIMSRMLRNVTPSLFWVLKRDAIDYRYLMKDQMVNHYCKAGSFTTKVGLCVNMKNVVWFDNCDHDTFFPRCYRLSHDEERDAFIDDYRLTACMNIVKVAIRQHASSGGGPGKNKSCNSPDCNTARRSAKLDKCVCSIAAEGNTNKDIRTPDANINEQNDDDFQPVITHLAALKKKNKQRYLIPVQVLETAIYQCEKFLASKDHEDIDVPREVGQLTGQQWDDLIKWHYQLVHEEGTFTQIPLHLAKQCESLARRLASQCPQFDMDGVRNVWIVKPGAKSRGRGILCFEKLEDMLKLVCTQVVKKDGKYVVQKYIERPLLIYNTKFDIRQWFLVTDWNPLTLWFYQDSYLRFCSQQFTLEDFDQSIHLSNNAVQKHYKNGPRSSRLPEENMWTNDEFKKYLTSKKLPDIWDEMIYPQMKRAIVCSLLVTQDLVEYRKSSFELYGADFMLTEDFRPWLIEINSSPSMEYSTSVTAKLCAAVLDDTLKVVVDRKFDGNCDIGRFELAYKQPLVTVPPYIGVSLCVEGQAVKKPSWLVRPTEPSRPAESSCIGSNETLFTPRPVTTKLTLSERVLEQSRALNTNSLDSNPGTTSDPSETAPLKKESNNITAGFSCKNILVASRKEIAPKIILTQTGNETDMNKPTIPSKGLTENMSVSQCNEAGIVSDQKGPASGDVSKPVKKQIKFTEGKKPENGTSNVADSGVGIQKIGDTLPKSTTQKISALSPIPQNINPSSTTPAPNQSRGSSRPAAAAAVMPTVIGTSTPVLNPAPGKNTNDSHVAKLNPKGTLTSTGSSNWNRACQWCGRGGNLHLDSVDPNCRCQKDSLLITMQIDSNNPKASQELVTLNNQQKSWQKKVTKSNKPMNDSPGTSVGHHDGAEIRTNTSASTPTRGQESLPQRPALALSISVDGTNLSSYSRVQKMKKSVSHASRQTNTTLNSQIILQQNEPRQIDLNTNRQLYRNDSFSTLPISPSSPNYPSHCSPEAIARSLYRQEMQAKRGLLGSMFSHRVRKLLVKKGSNNRSLMEIWPSVTCIDSSVCHNPLAVIAQRQISIQQQK